jgi:hypothetical protein
MQAYQTRLLQTASAVAGSKHAFPPAFAELDLEEDEYRRPPSAGAPPASAATNLFRFSESTSDLTTASAHVCGQPSGPHCAPV